MNTLEERVDIRGKCADKVEINKIYNIDCLELMAHMPTDFVDLIITSPPYNFNAGSSLKNKYNNLLRDNLTQDEYYEWSVKVITECMRVAKLVCWNIQLIAGNKEALLRYIGYFNKNIRDILIWDKQNSEPAMSEKVFNSEFEFIILFDKNGGGRKIERAKFARGTVSNVIRVFRMINTKKDESIRKTHCAVFPDLIPIKLMEYFTDENDIVFDPFMGSGTTIINAIKYNRRFIGSELVKEYYDYAVEKIESELSQYKLLFSTSGQQSATSKRNEDELSQYKLL